LNGGHINGYWLDKTEETRVISEIKKLIDPNNYSAKYNSSNDSDDILLFAMGDGNHSLATAKAIWEKTKNEKGMDHPSRYALVELVNIHSDALEFEPIHRVIFNAGEILDALKEEFKDTLEIEDTTKDEMITKVKTSDEQVVGFITSQGYKLITFKVPTAKITYGTLQTFLDKYVLEKNVEIDYVHGTDSLINLSLKEGNAGFFLAAIDKNSFFEAVIKDGALPRKTFSMGEAEEKRYYLEARKIE